MAKSRMKLSVLVLTVLLLNGCSPVLTAAAPTLVPDTPIPTVLAAAPMAVQAAPTLAGVYDDFNKPEFDGSFNSALWKFDNSESVKAYQENGALVIATNKDHLPKKSEDHSFVPVSPASWNFSEFHSMEVKMKLGGERKAHNGMIKSQVILPHADKLAFIECQMQNYFEKVWFFCNYANDQFWTNGNEYEYRTPYVKFDYDEWHTVRFEIDPATATIFYYLDNQLIAEHTPRDVAAVKASQVIAHLGSFANQGDSFIGYFDEVKFNQ